MQSDGWAILTAGPGEGQSCQKFMTSLRRSSRVDFWIPTIAFSPGRSSQDSAYSSRSRWIYEMTSRQVEIDAVPQIIHRKCHLCFADIHGVLALARACYRRRKLVLAREPRCFGMSALCCFPFALTCGQVATSDGAAVETDGYGSSLPDVDARLHGVGYASLGLRSIHIMAEYCYRNLTMSQEAVLRPIWSSGFQRKVSAGRGGNR
jgi:hypothetical protein